MGAFLCQSASLCLLLALQLTIEHLARETNSSSGATLRLGLPDCLYGQFMPQSSCFFYWQLLHSRSTGTTVFM